VTFWNWRRGPGPMATQGSAAIATAPELAPIELYTADARIVGWIAPNGQRVTDLLATKGELRLWRPSPGPLDETSPPPEGDPSRAEENGEWESLATARVTGNIHLQPGVEVGPHLLRSTGFIPLTDAYLLHNGEPSFEHVVSVVIVNAAHVTQMVPLVTLA
jgi:hypothetical protein